MILIIDDFNGERLGIGFLDVIEGKTVRCGVVIPKDSGIEDFEKAFRMLMYASFDPMDSKYKPAIGLDVLSGNEMTLEDYDSIVKS